MWPWEAEQFSRCFRVSLAGKLSTRLTLLGQLPRDTQPIAALVHILPLLFFGEALFAHALEIKRSPAPEQSFADNHCQRTAGTHGSISPVTGSSLDFCPSLRCSLQWRQAKRNGGEEDIWLN